MSNINWIGRKTEKGAEYIYCHWGGDLDQNGRILYDNYLTDADVDELLDLGDASYIDKTIEECCFYSRDRGEEKENMYTDVKSNFRLNTASKRELCFLWNKDEWWVSSGLKDNDWVRLGELMEDYDKQQKYDRERGVYY